MPEIYEDIDALVLDFIKSETDLGQIKTNQIINGCSHSGWKPKQFRDALKKHKEKGIIDQKINTGQWYMVKKDG